VGVFQDITERKKSQLKQSRLKAQQYGRRIVETVPTPVLILDAGLKVVMANRAFYSFFQVTARETLGRSLDELGNRQWGIPELLALLRNILPELKTITDYIVDHSFPKLGRRIISLHARKLRGRLKEGENILLAMNDVTEQKLAEEEQLEYQQKLRPGFGIDQL
jgi:PAS domain S-box-containing protein